MGCDIHAMVEVKVDPYGHAKEYPAAAWWMSGGEVFIPRNYGLFTTLAGVRNYTNTDVAPIAEPRGLPEDVSGPMQAWSEHWGPDGHSHSWVSLDEILSAKSTQYTRSALRDIAAHMSVVQKIHNASDVRLVFFFDN